MIVLPCNGEITILLICEPTLSWKMRCLNLQMVANLCYFKLKKKKTLIETNKNIVFVFLKKRKEKKII